MTPHSKTETHQCSTNCRRKGPDNLGSASPYISILFEERVGRDNAPLRINFEDRMMDGHVFTNYSILVADSFVDPSLCRRIIYVVPCCGNALNLGGNSLSTEYLKRLDRGYFASCAQDAPNIEWFGDGSQNQIKKRH